MSNKAKDILFRFVVVLTTVVIVLLILLTTLFINVKYGIPNYQPTDVKSLQNGVSSDIYLESDENILFKYENSKTELCVYSNMEDEFCASYLSKVTVRGKTFYNCKTGTNKFFNTDSTVYRRAGKDLYFIFLPNERRIKDVDSCGYTPEGHHISYVDGSGSIHYGWLYVVDTENNHTSDREFTNYSDSLYI